MASKGNGGTMEVDTMRTLEPPCANPQLSSEDYVSILTDILEAHAAATGEGMTPLVVEGVIAVLGHDGEPCELITFLRAHPSLNITRMTPPGVLLNIHEYLQFPLRGPAKVGPCRVASDGGKHLITCVLHFHVCEHNPPLRLI